MIPCIILHHTTKSTFVAYSERELSFEVNLPTNLGELTFKNTSKWVTDQFGVVFDTAHPAGSNKALSHAQLSRMHIKLSHTLAVPSSGEPFNLSEFGSVNGFPSLTEFS